METSRTPVSIRISFKDSMMAEIRCAISTPRNGTHARTTDSRLGLRSMISCAIRRRARLMDSPSITGSVADELEAEVFLFLVTYSFATSLDRIKGKEQKLSGFCLCPPQALITPVGPIFDNPIKQSLFEADICPGFFAFDPFMFQNLF